MKSHTKLITLFATIVSMIVIVSSLSYGQPAVGRQAPLFALDDVRGKRRDLATMEKNPLIILYLYFFDVPSRPSQEGLLALNDLAERYTEANLKIWGITISSKDKVANFIAQNNIIFPILLDDNAVVSDLYQARFILPTACILGPDLKVLDYIQGGGKTTEIMLVKLAEKELQRDQTAIAKAISEDVVRKNPQNVEAKMVKGYAELKDGDLEAAEKTFKSLSQSAGQGKVLGDEGMVSVYARKGQTKKALELAERVEKKAPDRGHVNTVKADILYAKGQKKEAQAEYRKAASKQSAAPYQKVVALNNLGRLQASLGNFSQARELYDQAVAIDPYNVETKMVKGYAELKGGDLVAAEKTFKSLSQSAGQGKVLGDEGMVSVYARKGQTEKALELAEKVEQQAPDRGHVYTVKADILYAKGQKKEAAAEYRKAVDKKASAPFQVVVALNKLGRLQASLGNFSQARELYDQAVAIDPYYIEAKVNLGMAYEKDGKMEKAYETYSEILDLDRNAANIIESMKTGNIVFNTPHSMNMEETIIIKLILDLKWSIEVLSQKLEAKGEIEGDTIKVTDRMEAKLRGPDFQITAITPDLQFITPKNMTEWKWEIRPKSPGLHKLYLAMNAYFEVYGNSTPKSIRTFEKEIHIEVTWVQRATIFFKNNWQWFWTSIFIPIFFWLWRSRNKLHIFINQKKISKH